MSRIHTKIIAATSIVFLCASIGATYIFVERVNAKKTAYAEKVVARAEMLEHERSLETLTQALETTKDERESLVTRVLRADEDDFIAFLALIENIGKEQQVILNKSGVVIKSIDAVFEEVVMNIEVRGGYDQVTHVVRLFEYLPYQSSLNKLKLFKEGEEGNEEWRATFEIQVTKFKKI